MIHAAFLTLLLGCGSKLPTGNLMVDGHAVSIEIAATESARAHGLMHRDSMPEDHGMLFVYPKQKPLGFWMKDTRMPLSIAFADKTGKIVKIVEMTPFSTDSVKSLYPAKYALEMNKGWFDSKGVTKGAMITQLPDIVAE